MAKKAVCVGINDYPFEGNDLKGCENDARAWADLLVKHYGFAQSDIKLILNADATRTNVMGALNIMVKDAMPEDVLVFTNSSHGTYVKDKDGDEKMYDEAICPYDCEENLILDDDLRELFADLPEDVSLSIISDSCFSGTVTREMKTPDDRRKRFLDPSFLHMKTLAKPNMAKPKGKIKYPESKMNEILLSGCTDIESSYDARIGTTYHGAMTYFAIKAIKDAKYKITYQQLHEKLLNDLPASGYSQHPQLEGKNTNKVKQLFT